MISGEYLMESGGADRGGKPLGGLAVPGETMGRFAVAFLNRKGGVGKTSCCHHLAGCFAQAGRRVLLIDADPQASLTQGLIGPASTQDLRKEETLVCLFEDAFDPDPARLIRATSVPRGLDPARLVPPRRLQPSGPGDRGTPPGRPPLLR